MGEDSYSAQSIYEDVTTQFKKVVLLFIVQALLISMYIDNFNNGGDGGDLLDASTDKKGVDIFYWLAGVLLQLLSADSQLGSPFNATYWGKLLAGEQSSNSSAGESPKEDEEKDRDGREEKDRDGRRSMTSIAKYKKPFSYWICCCTQRFAPTYRVEWFVRAFLDFCINGVGRTIIMYTFPIMLCVEGPLDFVKDCTAVLFITQLDDLGGSFKPFRELAAKIKFKIFYEGMERYRRKMISKERSARSCVAENLGCDKILAKCACCPSDSREKYTDFITDFITMTKDEKTHVFDTDNADHFTKMNMYSSAVNGTGTWPLFKNLTKKLEDDWTVRQKLVKLMEEDTKPEEILKKMRDHFDDDTDDPED